MTAVHHPDTEFEMGLDLQSRCVKCHCTRNVPKGSGYILNEGLTWIVELPDPCDMCGEHRVKIQLDLGF